MSSSITSDYLLIYLSINLPAAAFRGKQSVPLPVKKALTWSRLFFLSLPAIALLLNGNLQTHVRL